MHLETWIQVHRPPAAVWAYLGDISNVPKWDRGVESVRQTSNHTGGGLEFETLARGGPQQGRMAYRIVDADPARGCTIVLTNSDGNARYFKQAQWRFQVHPVPQGSTVMCAVDFKLRRRYFFLAPILLGMRRAIHRDLESLKSALENATDLPSCDPNGHLTAQ
jgi:carbon monoxide dehydrogenase subunit G